jgi:hypothetical protein
VDIDVHTLRLPVPDLRRQLLNEPDSHWRPARYPGRCTGCGAWYSKGTAVRTPHWGAGRWIAECCAGSTP